MLRTFNRPASMPTPIKVGRRELRRAFDRNGYARRSTGRKLAALSLECEVPSNCDGGENSLPQQSHSHRRCRFLRGRHGFTDWSLRRRVGWL